MTVSFDVLPNRGIEMFACLGYVDKLPEFMLRKARIPRMHWKAELSKIPNEDVREKLAEYMGYDTMVDNVRGGLGMLLSGPYGTGKSAAASVVAMEVLRRRGSVLYISAGDIFGLSRDRYDERSTMQEMAQLVDLLVIDDI